MFTDSSTESAIALGLKADTLEARLQTLRNLRSRSLLGGSKTYCLLQRYGPVGGASDGPRCLWPQRGTVTSRKVDSEAMPGNPLYILSLHATRVSKPIDSVNFHWQCTVTHHSLLFPRAASDHTVTYRVQCFFHLTDTRVRTETEIISTSP